MVQGVLISVDLLCMTMTMCMAHGLMAELLGDGVTGEEVSTQRTSCVCTIPHIILRLFPGKSGGGGPACSLYGG